MAGDDWRALATAVAAGRGPWRLPVHPPTRPEQMLALTARSRLSDEIAAQIRALGEQLSEQEWHDLAALARAGHLATLVYAQLAAIESLPLAPKAVSAEFARHYSEVLLANLRIRTALERLLDQLAAAGIAAVPLKGVVLAERLYTNIGWRPTRDIDLLVRRGDVQRVGQLLQKSGYTPEHGQAHPHAFAAMATTETKYTRASSPLIELHWGLSKRPAYRRGLAAAEVWARTELAQWHGRAIHALVPADELRFLAVHCTADHEHSQLNWLVDIAELVRRLPDDWRWNQFVAGTIAADVATPVGLALAQARAVLNLDVPEEMLTELLRAAQTPDERAAWQATWAERLSRVWIADHLRALPSRRDRTRFAVGALARVAAITLTSRLRRLD